MILWLVTCRVDWKIRNPVHRIWSPAGQAPNQHQKRPSSWAKLATTLSAATCPPANHSLPGTGQRGNHTTMQRPVCLCDLAAASCTSMVTQGISSDLPGCWPVAFRIFGLFLSTRELTKLQEHVEKQNVDLEGVDTRQSLREVSESQKTGKTLPIEAIAIGTESSSCSRRLTACSPTEDNAGAGYTSGLRRSIADCTMIANMPLLLQNNKIW